MCDKFSENALVKVTYFSDETVSEQRVVFDKTIEHWRDEVSNDFDGFNEGDRFILGDKKVRVYSISETFSEKGDITSVTYHVGPKDLNPNRIDYEKLK